MKGLRDADKVTSKSSENLLLLGFGFPTQILGRYSLWDRCMQLKMTKD